MISVIGVTGNYILQPELLKKHTKTVDWISSTMFWKSELTTFQKMLDERASLLTSTDDKKNISHFQNIIIYYKNEVLVDLRKQLRDHEGRLANVLGTQKESDTQYFSEHEELMDRLNSFYNSFMGFRNELLGFCSGKTKSGH